MKTVLKTFILALLFAGVAAAQGFNAGLEGTHTFNFSDDNGRNQASFESNAPLESINGLTNQVSGEVTFDVNNFETLTGWISVPVKSIDTGIDLRNDHMAGEAWLYAEKYPEIMFAIKKVEDVDQEDDNTLTAEITGDFTLRGVTKEVTADAKVILLKESEMTRARAAGDLLNVNAEFTINLKDYGLNHEAIGTKVGNETEVTVNIVGSNAK